MPGHGERSRGSRRTRNLRTKKNEMKQNMRERERERVSEVDFFSKKDTHNLHNKQTNKYFDRHHTYDHRHHCSLLHGPPSLEIPLSATRKGGCASDVSSGEMEIWMAASIAKRTCLDTSYCSVGAGDRSLSSSSSVVVAEAVIAGGGLMVALEVPMTSLSLVVDADNIDDGADDPSDEFDVSLNGSWKTRFRTSPFPRRDLCLSRKMLCGIGMGRRLH